MPPKLLIEPTTPFNTASETQKNFIVTFLQCFIETYGGNHYLLQIQKEKSGSIRKCSIIENSKNPPSDEAAIHFFGLFALENLAYKEPLDSIFHTLEKSANELSISMINSEWINSKLLEKPARVTSEAKSPTFFKKIPAPIITPNPLLSPILTSIKRVEIPASRNVQPHNGSNRI